jgi:hypothetical protein
MSPANVVIPAFFVLITGCTLMQHTAEDENERNAKGKQKKTLLKKKREIV